MTSLRVPDTLAATLEAGVLRALEDALAPPQALRAKARIEVEVEAAGEGTFVMVVENGTTTARKGFAKNPLVSIAIPKGGWRLLQRELQALVDGLPHAPELKRHLDALRSPPAGALDAIVAAIQKLTDACVHFDVKGEGAYAMARGPVDEATRVLKVALDPADIDRILGGAPPTSLKATLSGDRGVLTTVLAALGPVLPR